MGAAADVGPGIGSVAASGIGTRGSDCRLIRCRWRVDIEEIVNVSFTGHTGLPQLIGYIEVGYLNGNSNIADLRYDIT